jgi:hypothetical protein
VGELEINPSEAMDVSGLAFGEEKANFCLTALEASLSTRGRSYAVMYRPIICEAFMHRVGHSATLLENFCLGAPLRFTPQRLQDTLNGRSLNLAPWASHGRWISFCSFRVT